MPPSQAFGVCRCCDSLSEINVEEEWKLGILDGRPAFTVAFSTPKRPHGGPLRSGPSEQARRATDLLVRLVKAGAYPLGCWLVGGGRLLDALCARALARLGRSVWAKQSPADLGAPSKSTWVRRTLDAASPSFRAQPKPVSTSNTKSCAALFSYSSSWPRSE